MTAPSSRGTSGAGWSDLDAPTVRSGVDPDPAHPFRVAAGGRYQELDVVGRGGMGQVVVARDRRLGRDVALKRIAAPDDPPALAARLAREARVTAVLEHPSIVPVYDAGVGDDGRLFYTMRLIHGRSLAAAAAECAGAAERLRLLRPFLAVCEAVAYAHSVGVVHRDLKPANIMVGGFGETQVVDWGLAAFTAAAGSALPELPDHGVGDTDAAVGTPGYMSPEQAAGAPADPRADVWSLGIILRELATGERHAGELASTPAVRPIRAPTAPPPPLAALAALPAALPPELAAIVAKATARDPLGRYADAGEMAAEVARFLDGRRVEAHAYTTLELARRLIRRLRVPLALAATALLATAIAVSLSFVRITRERERALDAEATTRAALAEGRRTTAWALTRQAIAELDRGAVAEAGVLAAHALALDESADARGVVAAAQQSPHPRYADTVALPGCARVVPGSWQLALCHDSDRVELWQLHPPALRWRRALTTRLVGLAQPADGPLRVVAVDETGALLVLGADGQLERRHPLQFTTGFAESLELSLDGHHAAVSNGRTLNVVALGEGGPAPLTPCKGTGLVAVGAGAGRFAAVCSDGTIHLVDARTGALTPGPTIPGAAALRPMAAALAPDGRGLVAGCLSGDLVHVDLEAGVAAAPLPIAGGSIIRVAYLPGPAPRILAGTERAGAILVDLTARAIALRLPASASLWFKATPEGVVTGGLQAGRWQIDDHLRPRAWLAPAGLSSVTATADRRWIAASRGDGRISIWDGATGALAAELPIGSQVVKAVAFSPDGGRLAISTGPDHGAPSQLAAGTWAPLPLERAVHAARRLAFTAAGELVAAHYAPPTSLWSPAGARRALPGPEVYDLATTPDRRALLLLGTDGEIWALERGQLRRVAHAPGASSLATWAGGAAIATAHPTSIQIHAGAAPVRRLESPVRVFDLAVSPDERYLAAARADGTLAVWRLADDRLIAILRGHTQRVAHVIITPDSIALSAGWDGAVLAWDLRTLDAAPASLIAAMEASWGLDLPRTLSTAAPPPRDPLPRDPP